VKFRQAELIGVPLLLVVGRDFAKSGHIELQWRDQDTKLVVKDEVPLTVAGIVEQELSDLNAIS
jgi:prolyl-tRNA synthetase